MCLTPIRVQNKRTKEYIEVECRKCRNCIAKRISAITFLAERELLERYKKGQGATFATLTYKESELPRTKDNRPTLRIKDVQNFNKRLRQKLKRKNLGDYKYIYCGEMGEQNQRPHYHIILMGVSQAIAQTLIQDTWGKGITQVGTLASGGLRYVIKYLEKAEYGLVSKTIMKENGEEPPFIHISQNIGQEWLVKNEDRIAKQNFKFIQNGKKRTYPKKIVEWVAKRKNINYKEIIGKELADRTEQERIEERTHAEIMETMRTETARQKGIALKQTWKKKKNWTRYKPKEKTIFD